MLVTRGRRCRRRPLRLPRVGRLPRQLPRWVEARWAPPGSLPPPRAAATDHGGGSHCCVACHRRRSAAAAAGHCCLLVRRAAATSTSGGGGDLPWCRCGAPPVTPRNGRRGGERGRGRKAAAMGRRPRCRRRPLPLWRLPPRLATGTAPRVAGRAPLPPFLLTATSAVAPFRPRRRSRRRRSASSPVASPLALSPWPHWRRRCQQAMPPTGGPVSGGG